MTYNSDRQKEIHEKGMNFGSIKVQNEIIDDAILKLMRHDRFSEALKVTKENFFKLAKECNIDKLAYLSNEFMRISGIYERLVLYLAKIYRYDTYVYPVFENEEKATQDNNRMLMKDFRKCVNFIESSNLKGLFGDIALKVIRDGRYYGYIIDDVKDSLVLQELPYKYCRSIYNKGTIPVVEFNMRYFDDAFSDPQYRIKIIKMFPPEFAEGYLLYKEGKLPKEHYYDTDGWFTLTPGNAVKFNLNGSDIPTLVNIIPALLDLDDANDINKKRTLQQLLKIVIQKLPLTPDGELIFDMDEAADIHSNAVNMLKRALGVDVLTTFADVQVANTTDKNTTVTVDELAKMERQVFNQSGVSQNLFNSEGNISLERSIANDTGSMRDLIIQFQNFLDFCMKKYKFNKINKYYFRVKMLETTIYNYTDLSSKYQELIKFGYPKLLPMIALGHGQLEILDTMKFENEFLELYKIMVPPATSNTINGQDILGNSNKNNSDKKDNNIEDSEEKQVGRPTKSEEDLSDKSIQNRNSQ